MRIQTNLNAIKGVRALASNELSADRALARLSTGLRINSSGDDAAGLAMSERLRAQIRGTMMAMRNTQDGISYLRLADEALGGTMDALHHIAGVAVEAANGTYTNADRAHMNAEVQQAIAGINQTIMATNFNGVYFTTGLITPLNFQVGPNAGDTITAPMITPALLAAYTAFGGLSVASQGQAQTAITTTNTMVSALTELRIQFGAMTNRLESTYANLASSHVDLSAAESRIRDADMATEVVAKTRAQLTSQTSLAMIRESALMPERVRALLQDPLSA